MKHAGVGQVLLALVLILCLTGCWDRTEIEYRAFAVALAVDKADETANGTPDGGNRFTVSGAVPSLSKETDKNKPGGAMILKATGETVTQALRSLESQTGKRIYLGQAKVVALGKSLTEDEALFLAALQTLDGHADISRSVPLLAAQGDASALLETRPPDESTPGLYIAEMYKQKDKLSGVSFRCDLDTLTALLHETGHALIPAVESDDEVPRLRGAVAMKDFRRVGTFNAEEIRGYAWSVPDMCRGATVTADADGVYIPMEVNKHNASLSFDEADDRLRCTVTVRVTGRVMEYAFADDLKNDQAAHTRLTRCYADTIADEIRTTVDKMRLEWGMDGYHWLDKLRVQNATLYRKYKQDWERAFLEMEVEPSVRVDWQFYP